MRTPTATRVAFAATCALALITAGCTTTPRRRRAPPPPATTAPAAPPALPQPARANLARASLVFVGRCDSFDPGPLGWSGSSKVYARVVYTIERVLQGDAALVGRSITIHHALYGPNWFVADDASLRPEVFGHHARLLVFARPRGDLMEDLGSDDTILPATADILDALTAVTPAAAPVAVTLDLAQPSVHVGAATPVTIRIVNQTQAALTTTDSVDRRPERGARQ